MADFDPDKFLEKHKNKKEEEAAFDPDAFLAKSKQPKEEEAELTGDDLENEKTKAEWAGFFDEITLGLSDNIVGGLKAGKKWALNETANSLSDQYDIETKEARKALEEIKSKYPDAYETGEWTGIIAPMLTGLGGIVKGAAGAGIKQAGKQALKHGAKGAGEAGVAAVGHSDADLLSADAAEVFTEGAAEGAAASLALKGAGKAFQKGKDATKKALGKAARNMQIKGAGLTAGKLGKMTEEQKEKAAKFLKDNNIISPNKEVTKANARALRESALEDLVQFRKKTGIAGQDIIDTEGFSKKTDDILKEFRDPDIDKASIGLINKYKKAVKERGNDLDHLYYLRTRLGPITQSSGETAQAAKMLYKELSNSLEEGLERVQAQLKDPDLVQKHKALSQNFGHAALISEFAERQANKADQGVLKKFVPRSAYEAAYATSRPVKYTTHRALGAVADKYGASLTNQMDSILKKGGKEAQSLKEALDSRKLARAASIALGKDTGQEAEKENKKRDTRELLKMLQKPE